MWHMCTKSTGYNFVHSKYTESNAEVIRLKLWMRQLFPDAHELHYFLKYIASFLQSGSPDMIWIGQGNNGKSKVVSLVSHTMGEYMVKMPASVLAEAPKHSSSATPCLARAVKSKIVALDEGDEKAPLRPSVFKPFVGGDKFYFRNLYQAGEEQEVFFKLLLVCNRVPPIPNTDYATTSKLRVIRFKSKWTHMAPESEEERWAERHFKCDTNFDNTIPSLSGPLMWLLTKYWVHYVREGLTDVPQSILDSTEEFVASCDTSAQFCEYFLTQHKVLTPDQTPMSLRISCTEVYSSYKQWCLTSGREAMCLSIEAFNESLQGHLKHPRQVGGMWHGLTMSAAVKTGNATYSVESNSTSGVCTGSESYSDHCNGSDVESTSSDLDKFDYLI